MKNRKWRNETHKGICEQMDRLEQVYDSMYKKYEYFPSNRAIKEILGIIEQWEYLVSKIIEMDYILKKLKRL